MHVQLRMAQLNLDRRAAVKSNGEALRNLLQLKELQNHFVSYRSKVGAFHLREEAQKKMPESVILQPLLRIKSGTPYILNHFCSFYTIAKFHHQGGFFQLSGIIQIDLGQKLFTRSENQKFENPKSLSDLVVSYRLIQGQNCLLEVKTRKSYDPRI